MSSSPKEKKDFLNFFSLSLDDESDYSYIHQNLNAYKHITFKREEEHFYFYYYFYYYYYYYYENDDNCAFFCRDIITKICADDSDEREEFDDAEHDWKQKHCIIHKKNTFEKQQL